MDTKAATTTTERPDLQELISLWDKLDGKAREFILGLVRYLALTEDVPASLDLAA